MLYNSFLYIRQAAVIGLGDDAIEEDSSYCFGDFYPFKVNVIYLIINKRVHPYYLLRYIKYQII